MPLTQNAKISLLDFKIQREITSYNRLWDTSHELYVNLCFAFLLNRSVTLPPHVSNKDVRTCPEGL